MDANEIQSRVPEPALIRGAVVSVTALVSVVIGKQVDVSWLDQALIVYGVAAPLVLSLWVRRHVSPTGGGKHRK